MNDITQVYIALKIILSKLFSQQNMSSCNRQTLATHLQISLQVPDITQIVVAPDMPTGSPQLPLAAVFRRQGVHDRPRRQRGHNHSLRITLGREHVVEVLKVLVLSRDGLLAGVHVVQLGRGGSLQRLVPRQGGGVGQFANLHSKRRNEW